MRAVTGQVEQFNRAFDDEEKFRRLCDAFALEVSPMLELGVDVVVPAGGYPMLLFGREHGFTIDGATVLNGLPVVVLAAEAAVRLQRLNRTATSRRGTYALPAAAALREFEEIVGAGAPAARVRPG